MYAYRAYIGHNIDPLKVGIDLLLQVVYYTIIKVFGVKI